MPRHDHCVTMTVPDTVVDLKKAFLIAQTRLLNTPVQLPDRWQDQIPADEEEEGLQEDVVDEVLEKRMTMLPTGVYLPKVNA